MTEPAVATNIQCSITPDGNHKMINARKWFASGGGNSHCKLFLAMGETNAEAPRHLQQSMILVPAECRKEFRCRSRLICVSRTGCSPATPG